MDKLSDKKCVPCEGGLDPMTREDFEVYLEQVVGWTIRDDKFIEREFQFKDFVEAMAWVNKVAEIAEAEGHHPDIYIHGWNNVKITLWTHAIGGLSINDFVVATKIDRL